MRVFYCFNNKYDGRTRRLTVSVNEIDPNTFNLIKQTVIEFKVCGSWFINVAAKMNLLGDLEGTITEGIKKYEKPGFFEVPGEFKIVSIPKLM